MQIAPLHASSVPGASGPEANPAKIRQSAVDFEALLLAQVLRSARSDDGDNQESSTMLELGEQQFAQMLASHGGLGIAKMVEAGLTKHADR